MADKITPMMKQYQGMRRSLPEDVLLLFRLGDFYEMFFEDAKVASGLLNVALTRRNGIPMCGVPYHAAENYIAKLIKANKRVAICDQVSEPKPGKIVEREITQIISAGTVDDLNLLESRQNNYLAAVNVEKRCYGVAFIDLSTGEFQLADLPDFGAVEDELTRLQPAEVLYRDDQAEEFHSLRAGLEYEPYPFFADQAEFALKEHFQVHSLDGFGCGDLQAAVGAAGAILHYLQHQLRRKMDHVRRMRAYHRHDYLMLDRVSQINLELVESRGGRSHSLLGALDKTVTPMGGRKLRQWLLHPLRDLEALRRRQELISEFVDEPFLLSAVRETLQEVRDVERTLSRLCQGSGNARDALALKNSLLQVPDLKEHLRALGRSRLESEENEKDQPESEGTSDPGGQSLRVQIQERLHELPELTGLLEKALAEEPPATLKDGGIFADGYNKDLDDLRMGSREGKQWITKLQQEEAEKTGIKNLKVRFNSVFGYFIEITKSNLDNVPERYVRKQTMANAERYITPELKEVENKILGADEKSKNLEYQLFLELREKILEFTEPLQQIADAVATLDVAMGLAETARLYDYCRPTLDESGVIDIKDGRHPVLDQNLAEEKFVPNDAFMDCEEHKLSLITGPNMAGKSTFIRQVALIVLMAQMGSYVPAREARIGLVDRIFTRVGANDDLARGQSTFMVEMNETANIVNSATEQSLVILDEIGRGTSTYDGLSIAWSVAEYLHDQIGARSLFATHYHELTQLAESRPGVKNLNVAVREWNDQIIFLRKIIQGAADRSYGIQVARLAGLPDAIITRAKTLLESLENDSGSSSESETPDAEPSKGSPAEAEHPAEGNASPEKMTRKKTKDVKPQKKNSRRDRIEEDKQLWLFG